MYVILSVIGVLFVCIMTGMISIRIKIERFDNKRAAVTVPKPTVRDDLITDNREQINNAKRRSDQNRLNKIRRRKAGTIVPAHPVSQCAVNYCGFNSFVDGSKQQKKHRLLLTKQYPDWSKGAKKHKKNNTMGQNGNLNEVGFCKNCMDTHATYECKLYPGKPGHTVCAFCYGRHVGICRRPYRISFGFQTTPRVSY